MTQQGPQPEAAPNPNDIMKDILERAGLEDINDVPIGLEYSWGKLGVWKGETAPPILGFEFLRVFGLFQGQDEVRAYAVPVEEPKKNKDTGEYIHEMVPYRFTLSKSGAPYFIEAIRSIEVFKDEVAAELSRLASTTSNTLYGDAGDAAVGLVEEMRALVAVGKTREALALLEEEDEEEDEEDEEDRPDSNPRPS